MIKENDQNNGQKFFFIYYLQRAELIKLLGHSTYMLENFDVLFHYCLMFIMMIVYKYTQYVAITDHAYSSHKFGETREIKLKFFI